MAKVKYQERGEENTLRSDDKEPTCIKTATPPRGDVLLCFQSCACLC